MNTTFTLHYITFHYINGTVFIFFHVHLNAKGTYHVILIAICTSQSTFFYGHPFLLPPSRYHGARYHGRFPYCETLLKTEGPFCHQPARRFKRFSKVIFIALDHVTGVDHVNEPTKGHKTLCLCIFKQINAHLIT